MSMAKFSIWLKSMVEQNPKRFRGPSTCFRKLRKHQWTYPKIIKLSPNEIISEYRRIIKLEGRSFDTARSSHARHLATILKEYERHDPSEAIVVVDIHPTDSMTPRETFFWLIEQKYPVVNEIPGNRERRLGSFIRDRSEAAFGNLCRNKENTIYKDTMEKYESLFDLSNRASMKCPKRRDVIYHRKYRNVNHKDINIPLTLKKELNDFLDFLQYGRIPTSVKPSEVLKVVGGDDFTSGPGKKEERPYQDWVDKTEWEFLDISAKITPDTTGVCRTRTSYIEKFEALARWAIANDYEVESLSDLVFNKDLLKNRLLFITETNRGFTTLTSLLNIIKRHSTWGTGYLAAYHLHSDSFQQFDTIVPELVITRWCNWLEKLKKHTKNTQSRAKEKASIGNKVNTKWIFEKAEKEGYEVIPKIINSIIDGLIEEASQLPDRKAFGRLQIAVWLHISLQFPLRINNFKEMKITENNINFFNMDTGDILIDSNMMKNRSVFNSNDWDDVKHKINLPKKWWSRFVALRSEYGRPGYLFTKAIGRLIPERTLGIIQKLYGSDKPALSSHVMRTLIPSYHTAMKTLSDEEASTLLLDSEATFKLNYKKESINHHLRSLADKTNV